MALEFAADAACDQSYELPLRSPPTNSVDLVLVADWEPMVRAILADRAAGVPIGRISARFHNALADWALAAAQAAGAADVVAQRRLFSEPAARRARPAAARSGRISRRMASPGPARRRRDRARAALGGDVRGRAGQRDPRRVTARRRNGNRKGTLACAWEYPEKCWRSTTPDGLPMGKVEFGGIVKEACLAYTPEVQVGDYVIVHVGFAISRIDEAEAQEIFSYLEQIGELSEAVPESTASDGLDAPQPE